MMLGAYGERERSLRGRMILEVHRDADFPIPENAGWGDHPILLNGFSSILPFRQLHQVARIAKKHCMEIVDLLSFQIVERFWPIVFEQSSQRTVG